MSASTEASLGPVIFLASTQTRDAMNLIAGVALLLPLLIGIS
eukprot:COSAG02_NODE_62128_length_266_cov_1.820359_1_plen_41_part_01